MTKKKPKSGICSICGQEAELTREHIPPKGIFISPRPKNTITVFSCKKCNHDTELDDEYFRFWVTAGAYSNSKLAVVWKNKVVGSSFKRSPALLKKIQYDHKKLLEHHASTPLKTYKNEIVPDELLHCCCMVDTKRIERVACKIVKGLYFHHFSKPLPHDVDLTVSNEPIQLEILTKIIIARKGLVGGEDGEFIYWFKFDEIEPYFSRWVLFFYLQNYLIVETKLKKA
jgi:hypothetical protein